MKIKKIPLRINLNLASRRFPHCRLIILFTFIVFILIISSIQFIIYILSILVTICIVYSTYRVPSTPIRAPGGSCRNRSQNLQKHSINVGRHLKARSMEFRWWGKTEFWCSKRALAPGFLHVLLENKTPDAQPYIHIPPYIPILPAIICYRFIIFVTLPTYHYIGII